VYHHLYPHPGPQDPPDFSQYLIRHLITEVRIETQRFYGGLDTIEAKYPGLNYSHPPHRKRLARFQNHARLFRAFDELGLTGHEISELCKWEGTLWARQRYERDEGIKVIDTTGNEIKPYVEKRIEFVNRRRPREIPRTREVSRPRDITVQTDIAVEIMPKDQLLLHPQTQWQLQTQLRPFRGYHATPPRYNPSSVPVHYRRSPRLGPSSPRRSQASSRRSSPNRPEEMLSMRTDDIMSSSRDSDSEMSNAPSDLSTPPALILSGSDSSNSPYTPPSDDLSGDELILDMVGPQMEPCISDVTNLEASRGQMPQIEDEDTIMDHSYHKEEPEASLFQGSSVNTLSSAQAPTFT
jgi:hypothetical protein